MTEVCFNDRSIGERPPSEVHARIKGASFCFFRCCTEALLLGYPFVGATGECSWGDKVKVKGSH